MGKLELLNRAILEKNEIYIENEIKFLLGIKEYSLEDFDIIFKLINYVKWNSHYSTEIKNQYLNELSVIVIEKYSARDYRYSDILTIYI